LAIRSPLEILLLADHIETLSLLNIGTGSSMWVVVGSEILISLFCVLALKVDLDFQPQEVMGCVE
jgi:hypothetical protein